MLAHPSAHGRMPFMEDTIKPLYSICPNTTTLLSRNHSIHVTIKTMSRSRSAKAITLYVIAVAIALASPRIFDSSIAIHLGLSLVVALVVIGIVLGVSTIQKGDSQFRGVSIALLGFFILLSPLILYIFAASGILDRVRAFF